jgi:hypothetical protein
MAGQTEKVKRNFPRVDTGNVNRLAYAAGFQGVAGLAQHIRRNRVTVWKAVRWPNQMAPTYKLICEALNEVGN